MSKPALQLIKENKSTKNPFLDLGNSGLINRLPEELLDCVWLERLNLGSAYYDTNQREWIESKNSGSFNRFRGQELVILQDLPRLNTLDLCENQIQDISFLQNLTQLQSLELGNNQIQDISFLQNLTQLQSLDLHRNRIQDISFLQKLTQLQSLDLSFNQIQDFSFLQNLTQLQSLDLIDNQIQDISFLQKLTQLQFLDLSDNQIQNFSFLQNLTQLQSLSLGNNQIKDISFLQNLTQLQSLYLSNNQIQDYIFLQNLNQLQSLYLSYNQIKDIRFLQKLTQLQSLELFNNQIQDISFLQTLTALQSLYLSNNQIKDISYLNNLSELTYLQIDHNPFESTYNLNLLSFNNHLDIIRNILGRENETSETYPIRPPVKIILLGNHASGKSSLLHFILHANLDYKGSSTHILTIEPYMADNGMPKAIFFDFGGQDYYHGIYRAFLSIGSIYLLLWNKETNFNKQTIDSNHIPTLNFDLDYWLAQKNYYLKESSDPVFIIQTHAQEDKKPEYARVPIHSSIENLFYVSLHNSFNPDRNKHALKYLKASINELIDIIQEKTERKEPQWYIDFCEYILTEKTEISTSLKELEPKYTPQGKKGKERLDSLRTELQQFHNQGLVIYYPHINMDKVWLNPAHLVKHIHDHILKKELLTRFNGIIPKEELHKPDDKIRDEILYLLQEQKVIFEHENKEYIIPNFLPLATEAQSDYGLFTFGLTKPDFILRFKNFLPIGLINQLICFFGRQPDYKKFWRDQLLFTFEGRYRILINLNFEKLEIKVFVSSRSNEESEVDQNQLVHYLFYVIMAMYWDFKPLEYPAMNNKNRESEETDDLRIRRDQYDAIFRKDRFVPEDLCISRDGQLWVLFTDLIDPGFSERIITGYYLDDSLKHKDIPAKPFEVFTTKRFGSMKKIFISYSKFDEDYKNELQEHLINLKRENLVEVFDDRQLEMGSEWDTILKQKIDECDYFICLLSRNFLNVPYIYEEEMPRAFKKGKKIIPIVIKPCDWINTPVKDYIAIDGTASQLGQVNAHNKGKAIGLDNNYLNPKGHIEPRAFNEVERDALWLNVVNQIRDLIRGDN